MRFRAAIAVLEKLGSSMRAVRVLNIRCCRNESSFGSKGQKHYKTRLCELEFQ